jgi:hypothetical protein
MGSMATQAQQVTVDRIEIITFGIFSPGKITQKEALPGTNGITLRDGRELLSQTETVPGTVGATFGIQYVLRGSPDGQVVKLNYVTRFPQAGMVNDKGQKLTKSQFEWNDIRSIMRGRSCRATGRWNSITRAKSSAKSALQ